MLIYELSAAGYGISKDEKLMTVLSGLDEHYDSVFSTLIERMLSEQITIDDANALLLTHESRLQRRKVVSVYLLSIYLLNSFLAMRVMVKN